MGTEIRLTRGEAEQLIQNIEHNSGDASPIRELIGQAQVESVEDEDYITIKKEESPQTEGNCCICGSPGILYSDTCDECFAKWMLSTKRRK